MDLAGATFVISIEIVPFAASGPAGADGRLL
jgi:hypothetical protein